MTNLAVTLMHQLAAADSALKRIVRERDEARAELAAWHAECDKVGIPYDPPGLVRHHRANAAVAVGADALVKIRKAERATDEARAEVERLRAGLDDAVEVVEKLDEAWRHFIPDSEGDQLLHRHLLAETERASEELRKLNGTAPGGRHDG